MTKPHFSNLKFICAFLLTGLALLGCKERLEQKGFAVTATRADSSTQVSGISNNFKTFQTRASNVLLTDNMKYRIATIYKINFRRDSTVFIGSNDFRYNYDELGTKEGNQWNNHYLPGISAAYGYNMVNVAHFDNETHKQKMFFETPVLIKTLYYPTFSKDTLYSKPLHRDHYMISVFDEDTNKDGFINFDDLRRFYAFDMNAENKMPIVPTNYSVFKVEYDPANDLIYIFASFDQNKNGKIESLEPVNIFWADLKDPARNGKQF